MDTNVEIAQQLGVKAHTVGRWRKDEDWDGTRLKIDRRAGELFVEKIATDRTNLNVLHFRCWELIMTRLMEDIRRHPQADLKDIVQAAGVVEKAQKGQRLAKGLSATGETEEQIRAESEAEVRSLIDAFTEAVQENIGDEVARDRIRFAVERALQEEGDVA